MRFQIDAAGIETKLEIKNYKPVTKVHWDEGWCKCDFSFSSGEWLHYHKENSEVLLAIEVEELEEALTEQLGNKLTETKTIGFIEPDFVFRLHPQTDIRNDPDLVYVRPGCEIQDIYLEWEIYFWHNGLTDNHLTIALGREEIELLRDYLAQVINRQSPVC